jgi:hypothetical protein
MADFESLVAIIPEMNAEIRTNQEMLDTKTGINNEKFKVL